MEATKKAFFLYNEQESDIDKIAAALESRKVSFHFWRRDVTYGSSVSELEYQEFDTASTIVVFLGRYGWGPNQKTLAETARNSDRRILPVLIGDPPEVAFDDVGRLFKELRYFDLRKIDDARLDELADVILHDKAVEQNSRVGAENSYIKEIVEILCNGADEQRYRVLDQIRVDTTFDRPALSIALRNKLAVPEPEFHASYVTKEQGEVLLKYHEMLGWLKRALIFADAEDPENKNTILSFLFMEDPYGTNFWILAGLYEVQASYLNDAIDKALSYDKTRPVVRSLASALISTDNSNFIGQCRYLILNWNDESSPDVLKTLTIVAIPELVPDLVNALENSATEGRRSLHLQAFSNPGMVVNAVTCIEQNGKADDVISLAITLANTEMQYDGARIYAVLLAGLNVDLVNQKLGEALDDEKLRPGAEKLIDHIREQRRKRGADKSIVAGYASDTVNIEEDPLDIKEDVKTLTAVMLAKSVSPPLAVGLFGTWGSGKSYFMKAMQQAALNLKDENKKRQEPTYCSEIVQVEFNAWSYMDTNLWASLVSKIFQELGDHVCPKRTPEEQKAAFIADLRSARTAAEKVESEKLRIQGELTQQMKELQELQKQRLQKKVELRELRAADFKKLLKEANVDLDKVLEDIGMPKTVKSLQDFDKVLSDVGTTRGRTFALVSAIHNSRNRWLLLGLLVFVLVLVPKSVSLLSRYFDIKGAVAATTAIITQIVAVITAVTAAIRGAVRRVNDSLQTIEDSKATIEKVLAEKRVVPTADEEKHEQKILDLTVQEKEITSQLLVATSNVQQIEERIKTLNEEQSLAFFLKERTKSDDYRKYQGLISTIQRDFENLEARLKVVSTGKADYKRVERIILYIDDLDRCPIEKVMEVLQAVHLLLAFPLFVVVVGVDPRWLLHSLGKTFSTFEGQGNRYVLDPEGWQTTPQNYLEKIFQIPFTLKPMNDKGYESLMDRLLLPESEKSRKASTGSARKEEAASRAEQATSASGSMMEHASFSAPEQEPDTPASNASSPSNTDNSRSDKETSTPFEIPITETSEERKPVFRIADESLIIKPWESAFAKNLFPLIPTPRSAKRFSNIYRILKAPVGLSQLIAFEGTEQLPGTFQVPMLLLAILIGAPRDAASLFPRLEQSIMGGSLPIDLMLNFKTMNLDTPAMLDLEKKIAPIVRQPLFPSSPSVYRFWIPRVSRFSFDAGKLEGHLKLSNGHEKQNGQPVSNNVKAVTASQNSYSIW